MAFTSRWLAPAALAAALGAASLLPAPAHAQSDSLSRAIVDIANVVFQGGQPYDRYGDYGQDDRLVAGRDQYGRTVYYRMQQDPRYGGNYGNAGNYYGTQTRNAPPYGNAYGYYGQASGQQLKCNKHGKCKAQYYDGRYDRNDRDDDDERNERDGRYGSAGYGTSNYGNSGYGNSYGNSGYPTSRYDSRTGHWVYDAYGRRHWVR